MSRWVRSCANADSPASFSPRSAISAWAFVAAQAAAITLAWSFDYTVGSACSTTLTKNFVGFEYYWTVTVTVAVVRPNSFAALRV